MEGSAPEKIGNNDDFKCAICQINYATDLALEEHCLSLMHHIKLGQNKSDCEHVCSLCSFTCTTLSDYSKHLNCPDHKQVHAKLREELSNSLTPIGTSNTMLQKKKKKKKKKQNQTTESDTSRESSLNRNEKKKANKQTNGKKSKKPKNKLSKSQSSGSLTSDLSSSGHFAKKGNHGLPHGEGYSNNDVPVSDTGLGDQTVQTDMRFSRRDWQMQRDSMHQHQNDFHDDYQHMDDNNFRESATSYHDNGPMSMDDFIADYNITGDPGHDLYTDFTQQDSFGQPPRGPFNSWGGSGAPRGRGPRWRGKGKIKQYHNQNWSNHPPQIPHPSDSEFGWDATAMNSAGPPFPTGPADERNWASHSMAEERRRHWPIRDVKPLMGPPDGPFVKPPVPQRFTGPVRGGRGKMQKSPKSMPLSQSLDRAMTEKTASGKRENADNNRSRSTSVETKKGKKDDSSGRDDTKKLSVKTGHIIDSILKGGSGKGLLGAFPKEPPPKENQTPVATPPAKVNDKPPKHPTKPTGTIKIKESGAKGSNQKIGTSPQAAKGSEPSCVQQPDRGAYLLERAEKLCRELREKRELAKRDSETEKSGTSVRPPIKPNIQQTSLSSLSVTSLDSGLSAMTHKGLLSLDSPRRQSADSSSAQAEQKKVSPPPPGPKAIPGARVRRNSESDKKSLDRDTIKKLVNEPRSRKDRKQISQMLKDFSKSSHIPRPKISLNAPTQPLMDSDSSGIIPIALDPLTQCNNERPAQDDISDDAQRVDAASVSDKAQSAQGMLVESVAENELFEDLPDDVQNEIAALISRYDDDEPKVIAVHQGQGHVEVGDDDDVIEVSPPRPQKRPTINSTISRNDMSQLSGAQALALPVDLLGIQSIVAADSTASQKRDSNNKDTHANDSDQDDCVVVSPEKDKDRRDIAHVNEAGDEQSVTMEGNGETSRPTEDEFPDSSQGISTSDNQMVTDTETHTSDTHQQQRSQVYNVPDVFVRVLHGSCRPEFESYSEYKTKKDQELERSVRAIFNESRDDESLSAYMLGSGGEEQASAAETPTSEQRQASREFSQRQANSDFSQRQASSDFSQRQAETANYSSTPELMTSQIAADDVIDDDRDVSLVQHMLSFTDSVSTSAGPMNVDTDNETIVVSINRTVTNNEGVSIYTPIEIRPESPEHMDTSSIHQHGGPDKEQMVLFQQRQHYNAVRDSDNERVDVGQTDDRMVEHCVETSSVDNTTSSETSQQHATYPGSISPNLESNQLNVQQSREEHSSDAQIESNSTHIITSNSTSSQSVTAMDSSSTVHSVINIQPEASEMSSPAIEDRGVSDKDMNDEPAKSPETQALPEMVHDDRQDDEISESDTERGQKRPRSPMKQSTCSTVDSGSGSGKQEAKRLRYEAGATFHTEQDSALLSPSIRPTSTPASEQWDHSSNLQMGEMSQDVMARLYEISMKEEKVREKVVDVDGAIAELVQLMEKTEEQLRKRKVMKDKLLAEEERLRHQRMELLKGACAKPANDDTIPTLNSSVDLREISSISKHSELSDTSHVVQPLSVSSPLSISMASQSFVLAACIAGGAKNVMSPSKDHDDTLTGPSQIWKDSNTEKSVSSASRQQEQQRNDNVPLDMHTNQAKEVPVQSTPLPSDHKNTSSCNVMISRTNDDETVSTTGVCEALRKDVTEPDSTIQTPTESDVNCDKPLPCEIGVSGNDQNSNGQGREKDLGGAQSPVVPDSSSHVHELSGNSSNHHVSSRKPVSPDQSEVSRVISDEHQVLPSDKRNSQVNHYTSENSRLDEAPLASENVHIKESATGVSNTSLPTSQSELTYMSSMIHNEQNSAIREERIPSTNSPRLGRSLQQIEEMPAITTNDEFDHSAVEQSQANDIAASITPPQPPGMPQVPPGMTVRYLGSFCSTSRDR